MTVERKEHFIIITPDENKHLYDGIEPVEYQMFVPFDYDISMLTEITEEEYQEWIEEHREELE